MAKARNKTPWIEFSSIYHPMQHTAHVHAYHKWVFEEDQRMTRRLRGEEGPPLRIRPQDVELVLAKLRKYIK
jgi:hypothetical protein